MRRLEPFLLRTHIWTCWCCNTVCKIGSRKSARLNRVGALSHFRTFKGSHFYPLLLSDFQTFTFYHVTTFILLPSHMTTISQFTGTLYLCCFQKNWPYCAGLDWTQFVLCCARLRCVVAFSCNDSGFWIGHNLCCVVLDCSTLLARLRCVVAFSCNDSVWCDVPQIYRT